MAINPAYRMQIDNCTAAIKSLNTDRLYPHINQKRAVSIEAQIDEFERRLEELRQARNTCLKHLDSEWLDREIARQRQQRAGLILQLDEAIEADKSREAAAAAESDQQKFNRLAAKLPVGILRQMLADMLTNEATPALDDTALDDTAEAYAADEASQAGNY